MIHTIKLRFSNAFVLTSQGNSILIDTGCAGEGKRLLKAMEELGVDPKTLRLIIHTHLHADHCGSTAELRTLIDVPTLIHANENDGSSKSLRPHNLMGRLAKPVVSLFRTPPFTPSIIMEQKELSLTEFGVNATALLTPGHTSGSISIIDHEEEEVVVGDVIMNTSLLNLIGSPKPKFHFFVEDFEALRSSMNVLLAMDLKRWHVGHGEAVNAEDVRTHFKSFLT
ncbi:MBL fold metallo-hydrolase [Sanyastnella coralliicola]|uniref:MBL fold metallo-hydrolase n=1 Tax=Sanyastnella coralliicola TaxID=3069118 RepID=UPI0027BAE634|nr:MBL fold metallo-hydrolase [Longitalea sp. SCSIO 12813]